MKRLISFSIVVAWLLTVPTAGAFDPRVLKYEAGGYLGFHIFDETQDLYNGPTNQARDFENVPGNFVLFGGYFGVKYKKFVVEANLGIIPSSLKNSGDTVTVLNMSLGLQYRFENLVPLITPFVHIDGGTMGMIADFEGTDFDSTIAGGVGALLPIGRNMQARFDAVYYMTDSYKNPFANNFEIRLSFGYTWGGSDDMDGDGIPNEKDKCPYEAEDKDGFQDEDGCPDPDNDNDGVPDVTDRCKGTDKDVADNFAKTREDKDGFEDDDGCPDPDNDTDGVPDAKDKCPATDADKLNGFKDVREDKDGFDDEDGCPDPDNDGDSIPDTLDQCPGKDANKGDMSRMQEDVDGFEDRDGCPDFDNDTDGIPDKQDQCPGKDADKKDNFKKTKETINGVDDEDGCPDEGGKKVVVVLETQVKILESVFFKFNKAEIQARSYNLLNQVALTIKSRPDLLLIEIQGHAGKVGRQSVNLELSKKRAQAVYKYILSKGVEKSRLIVKFYGTEKPLKDCSTVRSRRKRVKCEAQNRRVEFHILKKK